MSKKENSKTGVHESAVSSSERNGLLRTIGISSRRRNSLIAIIAIVFTMFVILSVGFAFSWFAPRQEADLTVTTTDFEIETFYSVDSSEFAELTDEIDIGIEQFDSLKLKINYTGPSSAYIRVQLFERFSKDGKMYPATSVNYRLSSDWEKIGDYYYCKKVVTDDVDFVTGASSTYNTTNNSGVYMNLVAVVEAVQPDRFEEFFGTDPELLFANN